MANENQNDIGGRVGLDTTDFKAGVAELNRQIKVIDSGFRAAAAGMEDWGKSEEGLQQRISSLSQITDLQRQKVANLTAQYKKVAAEKGENSKAAQDLQVRINKETESLNKNLAEVKRCSSALEGLGQETTQTTKITEELSKANEEAIKGLKNLGGNVAKAAAAGIAGIGAAAVASIAGIAKFVDDGTKAMNKLQAQTGASTEEMEGFRDAAEEIYKANLGESIEDVANAMSQVKRTTGAAGDELKTLTKDALLLRDTFEFEVNESTRTANTLMKQFGITGDQAMTLIAQGAQQGADKNGDLLDTLNEYSPQFKALGFSAEDFTNILIQGAQDGAWSIDKVGDAIKEFTIRSKDGSKTTTDAFAQLGLDADKTGKAFAAGGSSAQAAFSQVMTALNNLQDPMQRNQIGVALFGTQFEDLEAGAILALGNVQQHANMSADTLQQINAVQYNDVESALGGLKRQLVTSLAEPIGQMILPKIQQMTASLQQVDVTPIVNGLGWIIDNAGNIAAGAASIGAAMLAWNVVSMIDGIVKGIKAWKAANEGLTIAQWALNAAQAANPIGLVITIIAALVAAIVVLWNTNDGFRNALIGAWESIKGAFIAVFNWVKNNWPTLLLMLVNPIAGALKLLYDLNPQFKQWVDKVWNTIVDVLKKLPGQVAELFNELPGKLGYALGLAIETLVKWGIDAVNWVKTNVPKIISSIGSFFAGLPGKIGTELGNAFNRFTDWSGNLINTAKTEIPKVVSTVVGFLSGLPDEMLDIGVNMIKGLWDGMKSMTTWIKDKVKDFAGGIVSGIKDALGIHSPSRVMRDQVGLMVGAGMAEGITNSAKQVNAAMQQLNSQVTASPVSFGAAAVAVGSGGGSTTNHYTVSFAGMLDGAVINVRSDNDIKAIARELGLFVDTTMRGRGVVPR